VIERHRLMVSAHGVVFARVASIGASAESPTDLSGWVAQLRVAGARSSFFTELTKRSDVARETGGSEQGSAGSIAIQTHNERGYLDAG
jgi:hypothetical protein